MSSSSARIFVNLFAGMRYSDFSHLFDFHRMIINLKTLEFRDFLHMRSLLLTLYLKFYTSGPGAYFLNKLEPVR